ncbi:NUDIX domain-containing protein [Phlyctema vagabunda]|uniref:NUDIX domain-containing protein n=1 Tax=Phlyctema vagabunda TaxID=108571 RepID=A0ABR4PPT8_9HELO
MGAIRECFEESGILLAKKKESEALLEISKDERDEARKAIHGGKMRFGDWIHEKGGLVDSDSLIPFTRWITPTNVPKRFTTQMYIYFLPLQQESLSGVPLHSETQIPVPTSDGGIEHTAAVFASCAHWLRLARQNEIVLFPPQFYLMHLLSAFLTPLSSPSSNELQRQRDAVLGFLERDDGSGVSWREKVMSPTAIAGKSRDGRAILGLDKPGPELKGSTRAGDPARVVLVNFGKQGPRDVEVRYKDEVLREARDSASKL